MTPSDEYDEVPPEAGAARTRQPPDCSATSKAPSRRDRRADPALLLHRNRPDQQDQDLAATACTHDAVSEEFPKPWTDETLHAADVVVTMGCGDACPLFPGRRYEDWTLTDPHGLDLDSVRPIRDAIKSRVEELLARLDILVARRVSRP